MPLSEPNRLMQAALNEPRDDKEKANLRQSLYDHLMSLDPGVVRQMLFNHMRQCTVPSCPTCTRVRERAAQRKQGGKKLDKRMSRFRGVAKSIGPRVPGGSGELRWATVRGLQPLRPSPAAPLTSPATRASLLGAKDEDLLGPCRVAQCDSPLPHPASSCFLFPVACHP